MTAPGPEAAVDATSQPRKSTAPPSDDDADAFCTACARGDLPTITAALARAARPLASTPDGRGFYPLQWAALNDHAAVVTALLAAGAPRTSADPAGQTALHWSAARNAVAAAAALLARDESGSLLAAMDAQGYTPLHVAAQHDAAAWIAAAARSWPGGLALARAARDAHGRTPLTWAGYKGALDAARLLLVLGADVAATDEEGATALHWAALKGHADVCLALVRAGSAGHRPGGAAVLEVRDGTGARPADLARSKGFGALADRLEAAGAASPSPRRCSAGRLRRAAAAAHLAPLTLALVAGLTWALEAGVVRAPGAPPPTPGVIAAGWVVAALSVAGFGLLLATARADPGVLPTHPALAEDGPAASHDGGGGGAADAAPPPSPSRPSSSKPPAALAAEFAADPTDALSHPALAPPNPDFSRLCVACRIVRPPRAKHCGTTGRCIARFDHYCPWTGCVIGAGNTAAFFGMLACWSAAAVAAALVALARLAGTVAAMTDDDRHAATSSVPTPVSGTAGAAGGMAAFLLFDGACALAAAALTAVQARQISINVTTAEAVGGPRKYRYLRGPGGRGYANPFDRGSCVGNWRDVLSGGGGGGGVAPPPPRRRRAGIAARERGGRTGLLSADGSDSELAGGGGSSPPGRRRPANRGLEMV